MHELGVVIRVIETVEKVMVDNNLRKVDAIILQIGELSSMIPSYVEACYPAAVYRSSLRDTKIKIEVLKAYGRCRPCGQVFEVVPNDGTCPKCCEKDFDLTSGREFMIKEIVAY